MHAATKDAMLSATLATLLAKGLVGCLVSTQNNVAEPEAVVGCC